MFDKRDVEVVRFLQYKNKYYLIVKLKPNINPLEWAKLSQQLGQLDPEIFSYLKQRLEKLVF